MTHRCTLHVTVAHAGDLPAVIAAIEGLGHAVECPAHDARERLRQRDEYLRLAHARMPGPDIWQKSAQLAADVLYFESRIWPRYLHLDEPPAELSEVRRFLFMAQKLGKLPGSDRQLHTIAMGKARPRSSRPTSTGAT